MQASSAGGIAFAVAGLVLIFMACQTAPALRPHNPYASAEEVEENFRGQPFVLGDNDSVALVRPVGWPKDQYLKLPFWFGVNILVPGVLQPREGDYYVISEATLDSQLDAPGEWMISAGSQLVKQQAVFVTTSTHYATTGRILPTIVQYMGKRELTRADGTRFEIPVLREVSLPMKWTLGGRVPQSYARYHTG